MHREGHIGVALVAYTPVGVVAYSLGATQLALVGALIAAGVAMVPDVDQRIPGLEHRGATHTVWAVLVAGVVFGGGGVVAGADNGVVSMIGLGVFGALVGCVAIGSHLLADVLTPAGITPFAPVRDTHYSLGLVLSRNPIANYALLGLGVLVAGIGLAIGSTITGT